MIKPIALLFASLALSSCAHVDPYVALYRQAHESVALVTASGKDIEYGTASVVRSDARSSLFLTDAHVVEEAKHVSLQIGEHKLGEAHVLVRDANADAALLEVPVGNLPVLRLGDSQLLEAGMQICVIAYPIPDAFMDMHFHNASSLYVGRIANVRPEILEVDAPIIPGESGGPVFDVEHGTVIGLSEARFDDEPAVGLVTPIHRLADFLRRNVYGRR